MPSNRRAARRAVIACACVVACLMLIAQIARHVEPSRGGSAAVQSPFAHPTLALSTTVTQTQSPRAIAPTPSPSASTSAPAPSPEPPAPAAAAPSEAQPEATLPPTSPTAVVEPTPAEAVTPQSLLRDNQLVVYYGTPLASGLGILGTFPPEQAASAVKERARVFDELNGDAMGAIGALDVIYSLAQAEPTKNGMYVRHLADSYVDEYMRLADEHDIQLILDLQIGRRRIIDEVREIERFLKHPRVHVAIDPEYAVGPEGVPIATPGRITGEEINEAQEYLADLVEEHGLPPKLLVVHQYMDKTIVGHERVETVDAIDYVLNMDGFGDVKEKKKKYRQYASKPPENKRDSFNIFLKQDHVVLTEEEILQLTPVPHVIFYQ